MGAILGGGSLPVDRRSSFPSPRVCIDNIHITRATSVSVDATFLHLLMMEFLTELGSTPMATGKP